MHDTVSGGVLITGRSPKLYLDGPEKSIEQIEEAFWLARKNILDVIFLSEREEEQLRETQKIGQGLPEAILDDFIERKNTVISSCVIIFSELCARLILEAQDDEKKHEAISNCAHEKQTALEEVSRKSRMAISQLGLLEMQ